VAFTAPDARASLDAGTSPGLASYLVHRAWPAEASGRFPVRRAATPL